MNKYQLYTDWTHEGTAAQRDEHCAASLTRFTPFKEPIVFRKGRGQYLWDARGNKFLDLLGMNVCISVGHSHPCVVAAAMVQAQELTHCTTMFYHPNSRIWPRNWRQPCPRVTIGSPTSQIRGQRRSIWRWSWRGPLLVN